MKTKQIGITLPLLIAGLFSTPAAFAASDAERIAQLEKQLQAMQDQIAELKKNSAADVAGLRDQMAASGKENVVTGDIPGSFRIPGSDSSVRLYGIAELNMIREFKGDNGGADYSTWAPTAPVPGTAAASRNGRTYLTARTSRIGIEGATPSPYGQIGVKVEGDFNNDPHSGDSAVNNIGTQQGTNSYNFRLRHAYLQIGPNWLIGQTWSTFMDADNTPETVDFNGPIGSTFIRQPMIRYTYTTPNYGNFTAAVENADSYVLNSSGSNYDGSTAYSKAPDLIARWDRSFDWGSLSLRGVSTEFRLNDGSGINTSRRGSGLAASGMIKTVGDDFMNWIVTGGTGIGRYFNGINGAGYDATTNHIDLEKALGVVLGYQHKYSDTVRLNFVYGAQKTFDNEYTQWARANGLDSAFGTAGNSAINRKVSQLHIGGFWTPVKSANGGTAPVEIGLEYIYGQRETLAGEKGDMSRINFLARYNLN